jgi:hypothetical protein
VVSFALVSGNFGLLVSPGPDNEELILSFYRDPFGDENSDAECYGSRDVCVVGLTAFRGADPQGSATDGRQEDRPGNADRDEGRPRQGLRDLGGPLSRRCGCQSAQ